MIKDMLWHIVQHKKKEREILTSNASYFAGLFSEKKSRVIAEVKCASPQFDLSDKLDVPALIEYYGTHQDIYAMSILIDREFFKWDISYAYAAKRYKKPLFFKEFVIEETQIYGAAYMGYDALLLLEKVLDDEMLQSLVDLCMQFNIFPIIEVDSEQSLQRVLAMDLPSLSWIGINARNLTTMEMRPNLHTSLAEKYSQDFWERHMFAFSGYHSIQDAQSLHGLYDGVLIGTWLVKNFIAQ